MQSRMELKPVADASGIAIGRKRVRSWERIRRGSTSPLARRVEVQDVSTFEKCGRSLHRRESLAFVMRLCPMRCSTRFLRSGGLT